MSKKIESRRGCFDRYDEDADGNEYASPPCYMHEVDPAYFGLATLSEATPPPISHARALIGKALGRMRELYREIAPRKAGVERR